MKIIKKINFDQVLLVVLHNIGWGRATCLLRNSITELVLQQLRGTHNSSRVASKVA